MADRKFIPRDQLSEAELAAALETCAQEPIHIPNLIQPHGVLFVVSDESDTICQVSRNVTDFLGHAPEDLVGKLLPDVIDQSQVDLINATMRWHDLQPVKAVTVTIGGQSFNAAVHKTGTHKVIELERSNAGISDTSFYTRMNDMLRDYAIDVQSADSTDRLFTTLVHGIRSVSGFDRVKLYRFDEDWNGAIVAEDKADFMPSYLGLTFPASDIPEQARKLYSKNFLRLIADISYRPVGLHPERIGRAQTQLDMSYSVLRSVSPVHIQYLDNIGVKASMSVSIMQNGKLWGLVACHNNSPRWISYQIRSIAEAMGHIFSAKLASILINEEQRKTLQKSLLLEKLSLQLNSNTKPNDIFSENHHIAMDALSAQGMAIRTGRNTHLFGATPPGAQVEALLEWCVDNMRGEIIYTHDAGPYFNSRGFDIDIVGGLLAVPIGQQQNDIALWFRAEKISEVHWAGNPEKPLEETKAGYRLTPRASFDLWRTISKGKSDAWSDSDIAAARSIAQIILENEKIYAERSSLAKTEFLSNMSHELRTPMGAVIGIIQILNRDTTLSDRQKQLISTLDISAVSLLNLINDLLDIAKIEANEIELEEIPFRVVEMAEDVRSLMLVKAQEKSLALNVNYPSAVDPVLIGDQAKIRQILINLVGNALKFTDSGYVNLTVTFGEVKNDVVTVSFEVADSGIGIPDAKIAAIFEKFVQADASITRKYGGTGLGLSITKTIATAMGGTIDVTSREGFGSRFTVRLPLRLQSPEGLTDMQALADDHPVTRVKSGVRQVLLAEDHDSNIFVATHFLEERGFAITVARNGREVLAQLDEAKEEGRAFDLIIMDVQMPVLDGLAATRLIRSRELAERSPRIPIMAMTANALKEDRQRCLDAGMDDYIAKPINIQAFNAKLDVLLKL